MDDDQLLITIRRGTDPDCPPVLITGDARVVQAVIRALAETLKGAPRQRVLRLAREVEKPETEPDQGHR